MAIKRHRRFQPQGVASSQAARLESKIPIRGNLKKPIAKRTNFGRWYDELAPVLARVSGAADDSRRRAEFRKVVFEMRKSVPRVTRCRSCIRALHGDHRPIEGLV